MDGSARRVEGRGVEATVSMLMWPIGMKGSEEREEDEPRGWPPIVRAES